jgi:hypothetical protein
VPYALRDFACDSCGTALRKRAPAGSEQLCIVCTVERSAAAIRQLHMHSGPAWDAWSAGLHRALGCPAAGLSADEVAQLVALIRAGYGSTRSPSPAT